MPPVQACGAAPGVHAQKASSAARAALTPSSSAVAFPNSRFSWVVARWTWASSASAASTLRRAASAWGRFRKRKIKHASGSSGRRALREVSSKPCFRYAQTAWQGLRPCTPAAVASLPPPSLAGGSFASLTPMPLLYCAMGHKAQNEKSPLGGGLHSEKQA